MLTRSIAALMLAFTLLGTFAGASLAAESAGEFTEYDDIRSHASSVGAEFLTPDAEERERPGFFDWMIYPIAIGGVLITTFIIAQYLVFQPRFSREAEERSRR